MNLQVEIAIGSPVVMIVCMQFCYTMSCHYCIIVVILQMRFQRSTNCFGVFFLSCFQLFGFVFKHFISRFGHFVHVFEHFTFSHDLPDYFNHFIALSPLSLFPFCFFLLRFSYIFLYISRRSLLFSMVKTSPFRTLSHLLHALRWLVFHHIPVPEHCAIVQKNIKLEHESLKFLKYFK